MTQLPTRPAQFEKDHKLIIFNKMEESFLLRIHLLGMLYTIVLP
jgi:hypothetical protein